MKHITGIFTLFVGIAVMAKSGLRFALLLLSKLKPPSKLNLLCLMKMPQTISVFGKIRMTQLSPLLLQQIKNMDLLPTICKVKNYINIQ